MLRPTVSSAADAAGVRAAAAKVVEIHRRLSDFLRIGQTLAEIDGFVARTLDDLRCTSCFYRYRARGMPPFPSQSCLSLNDCIVHGTAGYTTDPVKPGDLLKIDVGVKYKGWIGDAAWTYRIGAISDEADRLCKAGIESLARGVEQLRPGNTWMDWAREVSRCVHDDYGFHLVRGLGGHGIGRKLHEPPWISNLPLPWTEWREGSLEIEPGTVVAVEPMLAVGTADTAQKPRDWPIFTADGSLAVHYEHDVLITDDGPEVLTQELTQINDVVDA